MDFRSEYSVLESVEDNEVTQDRMPHDNDCGTNYNGSCPNDIDKLVSVENSSANTSVVDSKGEDLESAQELNSPLLNAESPGGSSPGRTKGYGLKKWKRIKRECVTYASATVDTSKILKRGLSGSGNPAKAHHFPLDIKQNSEGSVGSANVLSTLEIADGFAIRGSSSDSRFAAGSAFAAGTDSDNSEDRSSKSSTAASAPKVRYDLPAVLGHLREKSRPKNFSGKSSGYSVPKGQQGKGRTEGSKKPREERVKIEKENSHSSMESDSRSSDFVFAQAAFTATSNGKQTGSPMNYDGENNDEAHVSDEVQTGYSKENVVEVEDLSQDDSAADLSWEVKEEKIENRQPSTDQDPLVESIFSLQSVQEALKKEVHKLREIGKEPTSLHDSSITSGGVPADFTTTDPKNHMPGSSDQLEFEKIRQTTLSSLEVQVLSLTKVKSLESKLEETGAILEAKDCRIAELEATINSSKSPKEESSSNRGLQEEKYREIETELEGLFKQKIEAEVRYLALMGTIQIMKAASADQFSEEQNALAEGQALVVNKNGNVESKVRRLKKQAQDLEKCCENTIGSGEVWKMQKKACKLTFCVSIQLILLVMVFWLFVLQLSPPTGSVVPT